MNQFTGKIVHIGQVETFGTNGFTKRIIVLADQYNEICFELHKEDTNKSDGFRVGQDATVQFVLRGRSNQGRWYNTLLVKSIQ